jgi:hypothetical protein
MSDCATLHYQIELEEELGWNTIREFLHDNVVINLTQVVSNRRDISCKICMEEEAQLSSIRHAFHNKTDVTTRDMSIQKINGIVTTIH